jgi:hypothetical protein
VSQSNVFLKVPLVKDYNWVMVDGVWQAEKKNSKREAKKKKKEILARRVFLRVRSNDRGLAPSNRLHMPNSTRRMAANQIKVKIYAYRCSFVVTLSWWRPPSVLKPWANCLSFWSLRP